MTLRYAYGPRLYGANLQATSQSLALSELAAVIRKSFAVTATRDQLSLVESAASVGLTQLETQGAVRILPGSSADYGYARLDALPEGFGDGEFTFEIWVKATQGLTVASTASTKTSRWSSDNVTAYSASDWWYLGNFLLDGHNNNSAEAGTCSLQIVNSGRVRWTFGDGAAAGARTGDLHAAQGSTSILDGMWHSIMCVRRWDGGTGSILELWVDGVLEDTETSTARTNMASTYWDSWSGFPSNQDNWMFGAEKQAALGVISEWEHYMGLVDRIRFYSRAATEEELGAQQIDSGLVARYEFTEGTGSTVADYEGGASMALIDSDQYQWVDDDAEPPTPFGVSATRDQLVLTERTAVVTAPSEGLAHGDEFTVTGSSFGSHDLDFDFLGYHIEGTSVGAQPSSKTGWNFSASAPRQEKLGYDDATRGRVFSSTRTDSQYDLTVSRALGSSIGTSTKVYVSYWVFATSGLGDGQLKMVRIRNSDDVVDASAADWLLNYQEGSDRMTWTPAAGNPAMFGSGGVSFSANAWRRVEIEFTTPTSQGSSSGLAVVRMHNGSGSPSNKTYSHSSGANNTNGNYYPNGTRANTVVFQNYLGNGATGSVRQDDHYVQVGTAKRVELTNHATYTSSTVREIQPLTSWSASSVSGTINRGAFANGTYYLHVVGEDNSSLASSEIELVD